MTNIARLLPLLHAGCNDAKLKLNAVIRHSNSTQVKILAVSVEKKVANFLTQDNTNHDLPTLQQVGCVQLVCKCRSIK